MLSSPFEFCQSSSGFGEGPARRVVVVVVTIVFITFPTQRQYQGLVVIPGSNMSSKFTEVPAEFHLAPLREGFSGGIFPISLPGPTRWLSVS